MVGLPFFDDTAPAPTRVPAVEITLGGGGNGGGFGGLADAAASLLGGGGVAAWADYLVQLTLDQSFAPAVDCAELAIALREGAPSANLGDSGQIRMGASGALHDLFSGSVIGIEQRSDGLRRYRLGNASHTLAQGRLNQAVTNMTVQNAIAFGGDAMGLAVQSRIGGSDGTLPQYVFDDSRSVWDHMAGLASLRGFDLWVDGAGDLQLADQLEQGDPVQSFTVGQDLLAINLWQRSPHSGAITAFGGGRVDDGFMLRKQADPNRAQSGEGTPQRFYRHGALQSQDDLAGRVAAATLLGYRRTTAGELCVPGSAVLGPGRVIELRGLPDGDGRFLILEAQNRFNRREGWRTRLVVSRAGDVPGLPGLLGALGGLL